MAATPSSDEINFHTPTPAKQFLEQIKSTLADSGTITQVDGFSTETEGWRANIRASNTEPLLRLNVEARNPEALQAQLEALTHLIESHGATPADH